MAQRDEATRPRRQININLDANEAALFDKMAEISKREDRPLGYIARQALEHYAESYFFEPVCACAHGHTETAGA